MLAPRVAAGLIGISWAKFYEALKDGTLIPQVRITQSGDSAAALGFEIGYLEEVKKVIPKRRDKRDKIFSDDVKARLKEINRRWPTR